MTGPVIIEWHHHDRWKQIAHVSNQEEALVVLGAFSEVVKQPFKYVDSDWFDAIEPRPGTKHAYLPCVTTSTRETIDGRFRLTFTAWDDKIAQVAETQRP